MVSYCVVKDLKGCAVMDKEEILKRGRQDGPDEREQKICLDAFRISGVVLCVLCIIFIIYSIIKGDSFYPYCIMAMAYCCANNLYRYVKLRRKWDLVYGIAAAAASICWTILFIIIDF